MVSTRNENLSIVCCMHKHSSTERPWIIYVKIRFIRGLSLLPSDKYEIRIDHMEIALCFSSKNDFIVNSLSRPFSRNIFKLRFSRIYFPRDMTRERERQLLVKRNSGKWYTNRSNWSNWNQLGEEVIIRWRASKAKDTISRDSAIVLKSTGRIDLPSPATADLRASTDCIPRKKKNSLS